MLSFPASFPSSLTFISSLLSFRSSHLPPLSLILPFPSLAPQLTPSQSHPTKHVSRSLLHCRCKRLQDSLRDEIRYTPPVTDGLRLSAVHSIVILCRRNGSAGETVESVRDERADWSPARSQRSDLLLVRRRQRETLVQRLDRQMHQGLDVSIPHSMRGAQKSSF